MAVAMAIPIDVSDHQDFPEFTIDLSLPPSERFQETAAHFKDDLIVAFDSFLEELPEFVPPLFDIITPLWYIVDHDKYEEVRGIVEVVNSPKLTLSGGIIINTLYELESWCTSIIVQTPLGEIFHARNLDFHNTDKMRKCVYRAQFKHGEKPVFEAVMFAGVLGVYTGVKPGAFSVTENQRHPNEHKIGLVENLAMIMTGYKEVSWLIRDTLTHCDSYECAHARLQTNKINALGYIIVAGVEPGEGSIISRDRTGVAHIDSLNVTHGKWFLVQTNNDHWVEGGCYNRCQAATERMNAIGQESLTIASLRDNVLDQFPNLNGMTMYGSNMQASTGYIGTTALKFEWSADADKSPMVQGLLPDKHQLFDKRNLVYSSNLEKVK